MKGVDCGSKNWQHSEKFSGFHVSRVLFPIASETSRTEPSTRTCTSRYSALLIGESLIQPVRIPLPNGPALAAHRVDSIAAQILRQFVACQQMFHPPMLGFRLIAEGPGFQQRHFEPGVIKQMHYLARRVLAIVPRFRLFALYAGANVSREKPRMVACQNRCNRAQRTDVRR